MPHIKWIHSLKLAASSIPEQSTDLLGFHTSHTQTYTQTQKMGKLLSSIFSSKKKRSQKPSSEGSPHKSRSTRPTSPATTSASNPSQPLASSDRPPSRRTSSPPGTKRSNQNDPKGKGKDTGGSSYLGPSSSSTAQKAKAPAYKPLVVTVSTCPYFTTPET